MASTNPRARSFGAGPAEGIERSFSHPMAQESLPRDSRAQEILDSAFRESQVKFEKAEAEQRRKDEISILKSRLRQKGAVDVVDLLKDPRMRDALLDDDPSNNPTLVDGLLLDGVKGGDKDLARFLELRGTKPAAGARSRPGLEQFQFGGPMVQEFGGSEDIDLLATVKETAKSSGASSADDILEILRHILGD